MRSGLEGTFVNWDGLAAGLEAAMVFMRVGMNSWSWKKQGGEENRVTSVKNALLKHIELVLLRIKCERHAAAEVNFVIHVE